MNSVNLNFEITDLEGQSVGQANKIMSSVLQSVATNDPLKFMEWARKLKEEKVLIVDNSDLGKLKDVAKTSGYMMSCQAEAILNYLNTVQDGE